MHLARPPGLLGRPWLATHSSASRRPHVSPSPRPLALLRVRCQSAESGDGDDSAAARASRRRQRAQQRLERAASAPPPLEVEAEEAAEPASAAESPSSSPSTRPRASAAPAPRGPRRRRAAARLRVPAATTPDDVRDAKYEYDGDGDDDGGEDDNGDDDELLLEEEEEDGDDEAEDDGEDEAEEDAELDAAVAAGARLDAAAAKQQQKKSGSKGAAANNNSKSPPRARPEAVELSEGSPMYVPVLTDADLEADPPGHRSGYVAVIGRPNAGKSTLINAVVGQKLSIVTAKPQTTRHRVVGIASDDQYQMILFDTPGIMREQRHKLDERMMAAVVGSIKAAEAIVAVVDAADAPKDALAMFQPGPDWSGPPMAVLINKADTLAPPELDALAEWYRDNCRAEAVFAGCALAGPSDAGVAAVKAWAASRLPEGPTLYPKTQASDQPERFFVAEAIREQVFMQYDQEVPYCVQVNVSEFKERPGAKDYIAATLLVERSSQKGIVIGAGGAALTKLSAASRRAIEEFLGRPVYLELRVEVSPDWRQQPERLQEFGYFDPLLM